MGRAIQGRAFNTSIALADYTNALKFKQNPSISAGEWRWRADNGSYTAFATTPAVVGTTETVDIVLSAAEMLNATDRMTIRGISASNNFADFFMVIPVKKAALPFYYFVLRDANGAEMPSETLGTITFLKSIGGAAAASLTSGTIINVGNGMYCTSFAASDVAGEGLAIFAKSPLSRYSIVVMGDPD